MKSHVLNSFFPALLIHLISHGMMVGVRAAGVLTENPASTATLTRVDFGPGSPVAAGYIGLGTSDRPQSITFREADGLPAGLSVGIETLESADRLSFISLGGGALGGDFVIPDNLPGGLRLRLSGMVTGNYRLTSFHNTADEQRADFDVFVDGAWMGQGFRPSKSTDDSQIAQVETLFMSDGEAATAVEFRPTGPPHSGLNRVALNGFILAESSEPPPTPIPTPTPTPSPTPTPVPTWGLKPYLLMDTGLVSEATSLTRQVTPPERPSGPIVNGREGAGDNNNTPYVSVARDPQTDRFRMWYNVNEPTLEGETHLGYMESEDGINWIRPHRVLEDPTAIQFGASVFDEGPAYPHPDERYKFGYYAGGGTTVAVSADGLAWRITHPQPVVAHNHDITGIYRDEVRERYLVIYSAQLPGPWGEARRIPHQASGETMFEMGAGHAIIVPDEQDVGITQFYCMAGIIARGDLLIALVKILRDEVVEDPLHPEAYGTGWTEVAWSSDGNNWTRERPAFMPRNPIVGAWDHAMTWGDGQLVVGDETFLYYGGYKTGHKTGRYTERQLGLARMPRDRYVAWEAKEQEGRLRTRARPLVAGSLTVNADVETELRVRLIDEFGNALPGFDWPDCPPITGDSVAHPVRWESNLAGLSGRIVALEFTLRNGELYGFEFVSNPSSRAAQAWENAD